MVSPSGSSVTQNTNQPPDPLLAKYRYARGCHADEFQRARNLIRAVKTQEAHEAEVVVAVLKSRMPETIAGRGRMLKLTAEFNGKQQRLLVISDPK